MTNSSLTDQQLNKMIVQVMEKGYAVIDGFLDSDLVNGLVVNLNKTRAQGDFSGAGVGNMANHQVDQKARGDQVLWMGKDTEIVCEKTYLAKIAIFIEFLNRTCYLGIRSSEFHYSVYPIGSHYERHVDRFRNDSKRKLSMICYLNLHWGKSDGGELAIYMNDRNGEEIRRLISPISGRMVCFESDKLEHEVLPSKRERKSLTGWLKTG